MARKTDSKFDAYKNDFIRQKYDEIKVVVPKGKRDLIRAYASERGESVNAFINRLIDAEMKKGAEE